MSEIVDASAPSVDETTPPNSNSVNSKMGRTPRWHYVIDACVIVAMGAILFWGASSQFSNKYNDATRYQCYGIAFWQGKAALQAQGLDTNAQSQCAFLEYQLLVYAGPENAGASLPVIPRFARPVPVYYAGVSRAAARISPAYAGDLFAATVRGRVGVPGGFRAFDDDRGQELFTC